MSEKTDKEKLGELMKNSWSYRKSGGATVTESDKQQIADTVAKKLSAEIKDGELVISKGGDN